MNSGSSKQIFLFDEWCGPRHVTSYLYTYSRTNILESVFANSSTVRWLAMSVPPPRHGVPRYRGTQAVHVSRNKLRQIAAPAWVNSSDPARYEFRIRCTCRGAYNSALLKVVYRRRHSARNQIVLKVTIQGGLVQYPSLFHNIVNPAGKQVSHKIKAH